MTSDNVGFWRVWIVMTHGHRIDSIWTSEQPAQDRRADLKKQCDNHPDWNVELWVVMTNEVLRGPMATKARADE